MNTKLHKCSPLLHFFFKFAGKPPFNCLFTRLSQNLTIYFAVNLVTLKGKFAASNSFKNEPGAAVKARAIVAGAINFDDTFWFQK